MRSVPSAHLRTTVEAQGVAMKKRVLSLIAACGAALLLAAGGGGSAQARSGPVQLGAGVYTEAFLSDPDPRYRETLAGYDSVTPETALKIAAVQPARGRFDFTAADAIVAFAETHGQAVFGHTLSWCADSTLPGWLRNGSWTRATLLTVLEQHITAVVTHFRGRVSAWDVVNEALNDDGSRRDCLWSRVIGDDWIEQAFRFARSADPAARLFYNETRADVPNPKYEATVNLIRDLRGRGVPVDGVGLQYHLTDRMPAQAQVEEAIRRLGELGADVHISELDVPVWYLGSTLERKLARQAEVYRAVAAGCNAQPACVRITTWGFTDRYTWRLPWAQSLPLPFDSEYRPKPAWAAIQEALASGSPPPPQPPPPAPAPAASEAARPPATAAARRPPLTLAARLRRQRLRTLLARRALAAVVRVGGSQGANVELVARVRQRVIGRATLRLAGGQAYRVRVPLTVAGTRRLRSLRRARLVLDAIATDGEGRRSEAISRAGTA
jgi:endo-1,4-beta-xylanase